MGGQGAHPPEYFLMLYRFGDFELDEERFELRSAGVKVPVQPKVLDVISYLVRMRDRVVLKRELLDAVWADVVVSEASISRVIVEARRALGDELQQVIVTVRGRGFRFAGQVSESDGRSQARPAEPVNDPTFVGREASLAALGARLEEALAGRGSMVWISGEAGIGKTRTAHELARRAQARGALVLGTHSHDAPETPPFWPWARIVQTYASGRNGPATRQLLDSAAPMLAGDAVPGGEQFALFDTVTRSFLSVSQARPIVMIFDDVHWADEASLRLLQFFAREVRSAPILLVGTYRDASLPGDARARLLGSLLRESSSVSIPLRGMGLDEIHRMVEVTTGVPPSAALTRSLSERSGGNPLYLHQLLKTEWAEHALTTTAHELTSSMDLQQGLIESICRHLDSLSEGARELLTQAAVLGREFQLPQLSIVSDVSPEVLSDRLDEAARVRVLIRSKDGSYRFAHVLVRDVLYKKLSTAQRSARHRDIGEKLLAHYGEAVEAHVEELADHFSRSLPGGDVAKAIDLTIRAAELASRRGHAREAGKHWQQAAQALAMTPDDARRVNVELGRAAALQAAGQAAEAREVFLDAAVLARTFDRPALFAEAALGFASLAAADAVLPRRALLEEAMGKLGGGPGGDQSLAQLRGRIEVALGK
jgi:DNA-binding winged helix-turn-helix (wHTH) protein